jgi:hypothetical protein
MCRKTSIIGAAGLFATLLGGNALAAEGQYHANEGWSRTYSDTWGPSKLNASLNYQNTTNIFQTGLTSYQANQTVKTQTSFSFKTNALGRSRTLLEASASAQAKNYHNNGTDVYSASGLIKINGSDYLPSTTFKDFNEGAAILSQPFLRETEFYATDKVLGGPCLWQVKIRGKLEGEVWSNASRVNANPAAGVVGTQHAASGLEASAQLTGRVICWNPTPGFQDKRLGEMTVTIVNLSATPKAYSDERLDARDPESRRAWYFHGIDNPLTISGGSGRVELLGYELLDWDGFSSSAGLGRFDENERFATTWW